MSKLVSAKAQMRLRGALFLAIISAGVLFLAYSARSVRSTNSPALSPGAWTEIKLTAGNALTNAFTLRSAQAGWSQQFETVNDALEIRVGSAKGPLITFVGKGQDRRYTWHRSDGPGTVSIQPFVGDGAQIRLWARVWSQSGQSALCVMNTLYNGQRRQRWEFNGEVEYGIGR